jgi:hypothetical protein
MLKIGLLVENIACMGRANVVMELGARRLLHRNVSRFEH